MTAEAINAAHTFVHYHCSCPDVNRSLSSLTLEENEAKNNVKKIVGDRDDDNNTELNKNREYANTTKEDTLFPLDAYSPRTVFSTFALSKLYFCEDCHQIRCPRCVQEEIVCYYCPNCLFEVPTASVKSERNRCARNCFQCPICQNTLTVVASTEPPPVTPATAVPPRLLPNAAPAPPPPVPTPQPTGAPYFLLCGVCRWDSQEINMTFEKATGLALQLQKTEDEKPDVKEFEHLKEHFEKHLRTNAPSTTLSSHLFLFPGLNGFSSRYGSSGSTQNQPKSDDVAPYEAAVKVIEEEGLIEELKKLDNPNAVTTLTQRLDQLSDQPYKVEKLQPQRIHLRTKRVKRCRTCHHILIKPEQKAQAIKFKIKLVALNYIPKITIAKLPKLTVNQKTHVILKFSNPLDVEVDIKLTTKEKDAYGTITMPTSEFAISPYNEVWEYDDEDFGTDNRLPSRGRHSQAASTHGMEGIFEKKGSYTSIILEVTPLVEMDEFRFPLLVTYTYKATIEISTQDDTKLDKLSTNKSDDVDKTDTDIDTSTATAETSAITPSTNADTDNEPEAILTKEITKSLSFCTIIGLGAVAKVSSAPPTSSSSKTPTGVGSSSNT